MKKLMQFIFIACVVWTLVLSACTAKQANQQPKPDDPIQVVATIFPGYDFAREIVGFQGELTMLLAPGAEMHSYEPTPQDILAIQNCDVFIHVGGGSDIWVDRILESMDPKPQKVLVLANMVDMVEEKIVEGMEHSHALDITNDEHEEAHEHEMDEHVWTSPVNAMAMVQSISDAICEVDPTYAEEYRANTAAYISKLEDLDHQFQVVTDNAVRKTIVFGDRFPFRYLTDRYGLNYWAAFSGCSTQTDASAGTIAFLTDIVKKENIPVVFYMEFSNEQIADVICENTGATKKLLHSCHNISRDDFKRGATYLEIMTENVQALKEALS